MSTMTTSTTNILPSFSTLISDLDRVTLPRTTPCYLPSLSSLNLLPSFVASTVIEQESQSVFFSHKRKIEVTESIQPVSQKFTIPHQHVTQRTTSTPSSPEHPKASTNHICKKEHSHSSKKQKVEKPASLISVGSLQGVISEVLEQVAASDAEEGDPSEKPTDALASLFVKLRTQVYVQMLQYSETSKRFHAVGEKRFVCPFSSTCKKSLKGLGNLRRHIEWHLTRLEDDVRYQAKYITERITTQKACSLVVQELERVKKVEDHPVA